MNISSYGWVNSADDIISWENGLKWLSKAIVSDQDARDKMELKILLDMHVLAALGHQDWHIREIAVFYCLAWKKFPMLSAVWAAIGPAQMGDYLEAALRKLFAAHNLRYVDFTIFINKNRDQCLDDIKAFLETRTIAAKIIDMVCADLFVSDAARTAASIRTMAEFFCELRVGAAQFRRPLERYMMLQTAAFNEGVRTGNYAGCLDFLDTLVPVLKQLHELDLLSATQLRPMFFSVKNALFPDTMAHVLRWKCSSLVSSYFEQQSEESIASVSRFLALALSDYCSTSSLAGSEAMLLIEFAADGGTASLNELFQLCMDASYPVPLLEALFQNAFKSGVYANSSQALIIAALLGNKLDIKAPALEKSRLNFLSDLWHSLQMSTSSAVWRDALGHLHMLSTMRVDPYIEDEFFLPLLRESLVSFSTPVQKEGLELAQKDPKILYFIREWLGSAFIQYELSEGLLSDTGGCRDLIRLLNLYWRCPVAASKLCERLKLFLQKPVQQGRARKKVMAQALLEKISAE